MAEQEIPAFIHTYTCKQLGSNPPRKYPWKGPRIHFKNYSTKNKKTITQKRSLDKLAQPRPLEMTRTKKVSVEVISIRHTVGAIMVFSVLLYR